jgi:hypothetical protein
MSTANHESPYARDPLHPTDAELAAAINRGIASGQLLTGEEFLRQAATLDSAQAAPETTAEAELDQADARYWATIDEPEAAEADRLDAAENLEKWRAAAEAEAQAEP